MDAGIVCVMAIRSYAYRNIFSSILWNDFHRYKIT